MALVCGTSTVEDIVNQVNANETAITGNTTLINSKPNPNLLINGCFGQAQRGTAFSVNTLGTYLLDHWYNQAPNGTTTNMSQAGVEGANFALFNVSTPDYITSAGVSTIVENGSRLVEGTTITVSFDIRNQATTANFRVLVSSTTGSTLAGADTQFLELSATTTKQRLNATFTIPNGLTNQHLSLTFAPSSIDTLELGNVKLEYGSVATPFIPDDPATNLAKCQRYVEPIKLFFCSNVTVGQAYYPFYNFKTEKRVVPTPTNISYFGGLGFNAGEGSFNSANTGWIRFTETADATTAGGYLDIAGFADAEIY